MTVHKAMKLNKDENDSQKYPTTRLNLIKFFKDHDFHFPIAVCNATGLSAYHFNQEDGFVIEIIGWCHSCHNGTYLDPNGVLLDMEKEKINLKKT